MDFEVRTGSMLPNPKNREADLIILTVSVSSVRQSKGEPVLVGDMKACAGLDV
jgi:hypothetical protein